MYRSSSRRAAGLLAVALATLSVPAAARAEVPAVAGVLAGAARAVARHFAFVAAVTRPTGLLTVPPVTGECTSPFGWRDHPITHRRKLHAGVDMHALRGEQVRVAGCGIVVFAGRMGGYGNMVIVDHGRGLETRYAHLSSYKVKQGQQVTAGEWIADVGSSGRTTGPHLHFEVRRWGMPISPTSELPLPVEQPRLRRSAGS